MLPLWIEPYPDQSPLFDGAVGWYTPAGVGCNSTPPRYSLTDPCMIEAPPMVGTDQGIVDDPACREGCVAVGATIA